jgi:sugar fermentation stimulation protein A
MPFTPVSFFGPLLRARFLERPNRFVVRCERGGQVFSAFLPNPGRLQELLFPGRTVYVTEEGNALERKYRYTAVAVEREGHPIMLHTHRNNDVARALLERGGVPGLEGAKVVRAEVAVGRSRFDFLLEEGGKDLYLEVKSCTLVGERVAMFPDAVTERGTRHLEELAMLSEEGKGTAVLFIVHWPLARLFSPDYHTDLVFAQTLLRLREQVRVLPVAVQWNPDLILGPETRLLDIPWETIEREARDRGSYLLTLEVSCDTKIAVGKLGTVPFRRGFYVYVGSAMANLSRRMERHRRLRKRHHWHIDDLRAGAEFRSIVAVRASDRLECDLARAVSAIASWTAPGFGCSDCRCSTHLFGFEKDPVHDPAYQALLQRFRMDRFF